MAKTPRFKKGDIVQDNCRCIYKVIKVNKTTYTCLHKEDFAQPNPKDWYWNIAIDHLDKRGRITNE